MQRKMIFTNCILLMYIIIGYSQESKGHIAPLDAGIPAGQPPVNGSKQECTRLTLNTGAISRTAVILSDWRWRGSFVFCGCQ
jgi:hypothetical protein